MLCSMPAGPDRRLGEDPFALTGFYPHHSFARVDKLMPVVAVGRDPLGTRMPYGKTAHHSAGLGSVLRCRGKLTLIRHLLTN